MYMYMRCHVFTYLWQIILSQEAEVLAVECEMSAVHALLSKLPERLGYEDAIAVACRLMEKHPPRKLAKTGGLSLSTRYSHSPVTPQILQWLSKKQSWLYKWVPNSHFAKKFYFVKQRGALSDIDYILYFSPLSQSG